MQRIGDNAADQRLSALKYACRGVIGDRLRSVSVDSPEFSRMLYRRNDLEPGADGPVHDAMAAGASCQSPMFADGGRPSPSSVSTDDARPSPSSVKPLEGQTVCEFENGYVTRIQFGATKLVATMDGLKMDRKTELSAAVRGVLDS